MLYGRKWPEYAAQWNRMITNLERVPEATRAAHYAIEHRDIYRDVEEVTGVPWTLTATIHRRESDAQDRFGNPLFTSYLGNGQPLDMRTTIVPKGRGPFTGPSAFLNGAVDAYRIDRLDAVRDWRLEKMLYYGELLNGAGYAARGLPSPYLWGGTSVQKRGKFIKDGVFSAAAMDKQLGIAPILLKIAQLADLKYERET